MAIGKSRTRMEISEEEINKVRLLIEECLVKYLSQQEVAEIILEKAKIVPAFTKTVWQKLEEDNPDFFKAYHVRRMVKQQINVFNKLVVQQMNLQQPGATGASLNSDSNDSYIPELKQGSASYAPDHTSHTSTVSCSPLQNMNHTGASMSAHGGRIAAAPNMFDTQSLDNDFSKGMNGEITRLVTDDAVNMHQGTWNETLNGVNDNGIEQNWQPIDIVLFTELNPLNCSHAAANISHGSMQQGLASYAPGHTSQEYMDASIVSRSPLQNMNHRGDAMSAHGGRIEDTQTMFHPQSLDNCYLEGMNGEIIRQGPANDVSTHQEIPDGTGYGVDDIAQFWNCLDVDLLSEHIPCDFSQLAANICHDSGPSF